MRLNQERLRSIESLTSVASELNSVVQSATQPVFAVDLIGNVTEWNLRVAQLTGRSRDAVIGLPLKTLLAEDTHEARRRPSHAARAHARATHPRALHTRWLGCR